MLPSHRGQAPPGTALREEDRDAHGPACQGVARDVPGSVGLLHRPSLPCSPPNRATRWDADTHRSGARVHNQQCFGISTSQMFHGIYLS